MGGRPRSVRDDDGRYLARCCRRCDPDRVNEPQPIENFSVARRDDAGEPCQYSYECKPCVVERKAEWRKQVRERKPEHWKAIRAAERERQKTWRDANPEKAAALIKRYRTRVKADPERRAAHLEARRIEHHLRQERRGVRKKATNPKAVRISAARQPYVPGPPLAALVARIIDQRAAIADVMDQRDPSAGSEAVCSDLGIPSRTYRDWKKGRQARIGTAEAVLLAAGVEWHEVYSYDDHAADFLATEVPV